MTAVIASTSRILVVDDHPIVADGVRNMLAAYREFDVVGEALDAPAALRMTAGLQPDAIVLDLRLNGRFAAELPGTLKKAAPATRILIHTGSEEHAPVHAALRSGADGAVFKDGRDLVKALRAVLHGNQTYLDPRLNGDRRAPRGTVGDGPLVEALSPREYDVLCALALGRSTKEMASELYLAESTVRGYMKALLAKLGVRSRIEALAVARKAQLI